MSRHRREGKGKGRITKQTTGPKLGPMTHLRGMLASTLRCRKRLSVSTDEEAQKGEVTGPRSHSWEWPRDFANPFLFRSSEQSRLGADRARKVGEGSKPYPRSSRPVQGHQKKQLICWLAISVSLPQVISEKGLKGTDREW